MKISLCLPYMKRELNRKTLLDWCRLADEGPFTSLSCGERLVDYAVDMRVFLSVAAAVTKRVRIVPSLYVLPAHSEVRAAKEIATLDLVSEGRVTVVVGVGGREMDYKLVGAPFTKRHQRMTEQVATMRRLWRGEPCWEGGPVVGPSPLQSGGPPVLAGVMTPGGIRRVASWADGIYGFSLDGKAAEIQVAVDDTRKAWQAAGRSQAPHIAGGFWYSLCEQNPAQKLKEYVYEYMKIAGHDLAEGLANSMTRNTPEAVAESISEIAKTGCDELYLVPATADTAEITRLVEILEQLKMV